MTHIALIANSVEMLKAGYFWSAAVVEAPTEQDAAKRLGPVGGGVLDQKASMLFPVTDDMLPHIAEMPRLTLIRYDDPRMMYLLDILTAMGVGQRPAEKMH